MQWPWLNSKQFPPLSVCWSGPWWHFNNLLYPEGFQSGSAIEAPWVLFAAEAVWTRIVYWRPLLISSLVMVSISQFSFFTFVEVHWMVDLQLPLSHHNYRLSWIYDFIYLICNPSKSILFFYIVPFPAISALLPFYSPWPSLFDFFSPLPSLVLFSLGACLFSSHLNRALLQFPTICMSFPLFSLGLLSPVFSSHPNLPHFIAYLFPSIRLPRFSFHQVFPHSYLSHFFSLSLSFP